MMSIYKNRKSGFSLTGALIGVAVGVAIVFTAGALAAPAVSVGGVAATVGPGVTLSSGIGIGSYAAGGVIGGIAGGLLGGSSSSGSSTASTTGSTASSTSATSTNCTDIQAEYNTLESAYTSAQQGLTQAQSNLAAASVNGTSTSNDYSNLNNACYPSTSGTNSTCGTSNTGGCDDIQNQCNNLQALIDSTNQATCQIETAAISILPGGTASTTANPGTNAFNIGLTPNTIPVGGTFSLVTTISISNNPVNALKSFSISLLNSNGGLVGDLASSVPITTALAQVSLQYNFQMPTSIPAGSYTVKISNDANPSENGTAALTIGSGTATSTTPAQGTNNTSGAFGITLSPSSIHPGDSFTMSATVNSANTLSYSVSAIQSGQVLGVMASRVPVNVTTRPTTVQQTFKTSTNIPTGSYSIQISDDANSSLSQSATLTVVPAGTALNGSGGNSGGFVNTGNVAPGSNTNICTLGLDLYVGKSDATTGGAVTALQNFLTSKGYFQYQVTGYFGSITKAAVQEYQAANGVPSTGYVGPLTRAAIDGGAPCK